MEEEDESERDESRSRSRCVRSMCFSSESSSATTGREEERRWSFTISVLDVLASATISAEASIASVCRPVVAITAAEVPGL